MNKLIRVIFTNYWLIIFCSCYAVTTHALKPIKWNTANNIPVYFYPSKTIPMLNIQIGIDAGSVRDGEHAGLAQLTASLLNQGNIHNGKSISATNIAENIADTGAIYNSQVGRDFINISLLTLTSANRLEPALDIFNSIIHHPSFTLMSVERQKSLQKASIISEQENPAAIAFKSFMKTLYAKHPYASPIQGSIQSVSSISRQDVIDFYKQYYTSQHTVIVLVGAIKIDLAKKIADKLAKEFSAKYSLPKIPNPINIKKNSYVKINFPSSQTHIYLGQLGITPHDPDYFPLLVGNYILGGGSLTSQLSQQVREQHGYSYHIQSEIMPLLATGPFFIQLSTENKQAPAAYALTKKILEHFIDQGPTQEELEQAKSYMIGSFPLSLISTSEIARILLKMAFYQLPDDFLEQYSENVNKVSLDDIKHAFQKHWHAQSWIHIDVGGK